MILADRPRSDTFQTSLSSLIDEHNSKTIAVSKMDDFGKGKISIFKKPDFQKKSCMTIIYLSTYYTSLIIVFKYIIS